MEEGTRTNMYWNDSMFEEVCVQQILDVFRQMRLC